MLLFRLPKTKWVVKAIIIIFRARFSNRQRQCKKSLLVSKSYCCSFPKRQSINFVTRSHMANYPNDTFTKIHLWESKVILLIDLSDLLQCANLYTNMQSVHCNNYPARAAQISSSISKLGFYTGFSLETAWQLKKWLEAEGESICLSYKR